MIGILIELAPRALADDLARILSIRRNITRQYLFRKCVPVVYTGMVADDFRSGPYRLFFYSADQDEPPHVHVEREECQAKFWLDPVRLGRNRGFRRPEILQVEKLVAENVGMLLEAWHEYFGD